ncbi:MAG: TIGR03768 family metallophosphoesterase, partial [Candidatus Omnitrophica bacterium]|nr:TIGR03768 family metallophosphoesterase [Candidatus Omnitrophota bacterium]
MKKKNRIWIYPLVVVGFSLIINSSCKNNDSATQQASYPIDSTVLTTVERTIVPDPVPSTAPKILPTEISKFSEYGYGKWHFGMGLGYEKRLDIMPLAYTNTSVTNTAKLLNFFAMTDIHISDKESPAQAIFFGYKGGLISGYSPIMLYTTHVLD